MRLGEHADLVIGLGPPFVDRQPVDGVDERMQQGVAGQNEDRDEACLGEPVRAGAGPDRRRCPQGRGGVQSPDIAAILHDDAGTEEADAGHDIGDDARGTIGSRDEKREIDKGCGTHRDENIGAQARAALPVLPLDADQRAEEEGAEQTHKGVEQRGKIESLYELHRSREPESVNWLTPYMSLAAIHVTAWWVTCLLRPIAANITKKITGPWNKPPHRASSMRGRSDRGR
ncbi:hypothetical protein CHELA17_20882 [Chelatococcus asaccharovorans]|nr:hypothetical protein CHELA17_20882 [Chelatococcus asaccharovorans]